MKIALGCDHGGLNLKSAVIRYLEKNNILYEDFGCYDENSVDYPVFAYKTALQVVNGNCDLGILCCGTGIGISIAANKVKGIRAAVVSDAFSAEMTRRHNNANILCMGGRVIGEEKAVKLADIFIHTPFDVEERHLRRLKMVDEIEQGTFSCEQ